MSKKNLEPRGHGIQGGLLGHSPSRPTLSRVAARGMIKVLAVLVSICRKASEHAGVLSNTIDNVVPRNTIVKGDFPLSEKKVSVATAKAIPVFCLRVRKRRIELGLTLEAFGDLIGISRQNVAHLEGGKFPRDHNRIVAIAKALDVSLDWLFGLVEE